MRLEIVLSDIFAGLSLVQQKVEGLVWSIGDFNARDDSCAEVAIGE
jgi:hypothetical protein